MTMCARARPAVPRPVCVFQTGVSWRAGSVGTAMFFFFHFRRAH